MDGRLQSGDQILSINGEDVSDAAQEQVAEMLKVSISPVLFNCNLSLPGILVLIFLVLILVYFDFFLFFGFIDYKFQEILLLWNFFPCKAIFAFELRYVIIFSTCLL